MLTKKIHIAIGTNDIVASIKDYTQRLGANPTIVVKGEYALWRTEILNLSIRKSAVSSETVRHLGFEDDSAEAFSSSVDTNGITWERFNFAQQKAEIVDVFGDVTVSE